jgi:TRAP-type mannitol/chloroaromatic compound transport system substrate-binding protein
MGGALAVGGPVSGVTTLAASDTVTASGAVTVGGPLGVTGATTLNGLLHMPLAAGDSELTTATGASVALNPALSIVTAIDTEDTSAQAYAVSLAAGTEGQIKIVFLRTRADAGDTVVITPAALIDGSTITLSAVGHSATLYYTGGTYGWLCLSVRGAALA